MTNRKRTHAMKRENVLFMAAGAGLAVCVMLLSPRSDPQPPAAESAPAETTLSQTSPSPAAEVKPLPPSPIFARLKEIQDARTRQLADRGERARRLAEASDNYFDPTRFLNSGDAVYRDKVRRHLQIASWVYSNRKDVPSLRQVLILLLENGYGIDDYENVIRTLGHHKSEVEAIRRRYAELDFY